MKKIQLSGKERSVVRAIDFTTGCTGEELLDRTRLDPDSLHDVLTALMDAGFVEPSPYQLQVPLQDMAQTLFEINPGYAHNLKEAIGKNY